MALTTAADVILFVKKGMGDVSNNVDDDGFSVAVTQALQELNWVLPMDDGQKEFWVIERTKRYVIFNLLIVSANKFQFKKMYLQHRFQQYIKLLAVMDKQFEKAIENSTDLFDMGTYVDVSFYITNGFQYNQLGEDTTYL